MPRVSSDPKDTYHFSTSFSDGWGKIIEAKSLVFQYPPRKEAQGPDRPAGSQDPPMLVVELTIDRYADGQGTHAGVPPESKLLVVDYPDKATGTLDIFHPGKYPDGDVNADPIDQGNALGAEGDTLYAAVEGKLLSDGLGWMIFAKSLTDRVKYDATDNTVVWTAGGFKPAVLQRSYFPDLVGLYAFFKTVTIKKTRDKQTKDPSVFIVTEIKEFPYEKKAQDTKKPAAAAKKTAPTPAAQTNATPPPPTTSPATAPADSNGTGEVDIPSLAAEILTGITAVKQKGKTLSGLDKLSVAALLDISNYKPPVPNAQKPALTAQFKDKAWLKEIGEITELYTVAEDGKVVFA